MNKIIRTMKSKVMKIAGYICAFILLSSCNQDEIDYVKNSKIVGKITRRDVVSNADVPIPKGTLIHVEYNGDKSIQRNFRTTTPGEYSYTPQSSGEYSLSVSYQDSVIQFNSSLVQKVDIDTNRASSVKTITYTASSDIIHIDKDHLTLSRDIYLLPNEGITKIYTLDKTNGLLKNVRVCLYHNEQMAKLNFPYCGGSLAYLNSDADGVVSFVALDSKKYYYNARIDIGVVKLFGSGSFEVKSPGGDALPKAIILE